MRYAWFTLVALLGATIVALILNVSVHCTQWDEPGANNPFNPVHHHACGLELNR